MDQPATLELQAPATGTALALTLDGIKAELDAIRLVMVNRGHPDADASLRIAAGAARGPTIFGSVATNGPLRYGDYFWGDDHADILARMRAYAAVAPTRWSDADVAATLGIPAPATVE